MATSRRLREIALLRLAAQGLLDPGDTAPAQVVRRLTALQAQDLPGAITSVALRTGAGTRAAVHAALDAGEVVRSWPMRGTLHLVSAEDLGWMLELMTARIVAGARRRRHELGIDEPMIDRARELAVDTLSGGRRISRAGLMERWEAAGLLGVAQRGYHLLWRLAQAAVVCFGPMADGEQEIVLVDDWIAAPRRLDRDAALAELALRYFRGHGPATVADFAWWTKLPMADARAGAATAAAELESLDADGREHLMDPATPPRLDAVRDEAKGVFLLPGFDEFLLGYQDRAAALPGEHAQRVVPGANGMFRATVVSAGQVVGTWRHAGRGARRSLEIEPFAAPLSARATRAAGRRYDALPR